MVQFCTMQISRNKIERWIAKKFFDGDIKLAHGVVSRFLGMAKYTGFGKTRMELLRICYEAKTPQSRWKKAKSFLNDNLRSQIPGIPSNKLSHSLVLERILGANSFISDCITLVVLCNASDIKLPKGVDVLRSYPGYFKTGYRDFRHDCVRVKVALQNGEINTSDIAPKEFFEKYFSYHATFKCNDYLYQITHNDFFDRFEKKHGEILKNYKIDSQKKKPSIMLSILRGSAKQVFLSEITGIKGAWELEEEQVPDLDVEKISKLLGTNSREIVDIGWEDHPSWMQNTHLLDVRALTYELVDCYLRPLSFSEKEKALFQLARRIDYDVFQIPVFREIIKSWKKNNEYTNLRELNSEFNDIYSAREAKAIETKRKYWSLYIEVHKFVNMGFTKESAYKKLASRYNMKASTISTRYKEKAIEARKLKFTPQDIIREYNLF